MDTRTRTGREENKQTLHFPGLNTGRESNSNIYSILKDINLRTPLKTDGNDLFSDEIV